MPNLSWDEIGNALAKMLKEQGLGHAYYPYPDAAVDSLELPCVIVNEPQSMVMEGLTFSAYTMRYNGSISLLVKVVPDNQLRLYAGDIAEITTLGRKLYSAIYAYRDLGRKAHISLGEGRIARLSPYTEMESGEESAIYAGLSVPYTITVQYTNEA